MVDQLVEYLLYFMVENPNELEVHSQVHGDLERVVVSMSEADREQILEGDDQFIRSLRAVIRASGSIKTSHYELEFVQ